MKRNLVCLFGAAILLPGAVCAQAILEHAAAAAGATVGTAGGKALSNMIDKTLNKAAAPLNESAAAAKNPQNKATANATATPGGKAASAPLGPAPELPPAPRRMRAARTAAPAPSQPVSGGEERFLPAPAPAPAPPPLPTAEDFAKVKEGGVRQDVLTALGTPSSLITIPDDGHLIEIMTYSDGRQRIGSVRLDNGQVVSISTR